MWPFSKWGSAAGSTRSTIIDTDCAVITSIDLDHMDYLGPDRESIGFEKAGILRPGKPAIVSDPMPPQSVIDHAAAIGADLWRFGHDFNVSGDKQQWGWSGRGRRYSGLAYPALRGANQLLNAAGVLAALEALRPQLPITAQAVRTGLAMVQLPRPSIVPASPRWCSTWRTTHMPSRRWPIPRCHGSLPHHARRVRCHGRQGPGPHPRAHRADDRPLVLHRSAGAARRQGERSARELAGAEHACRRLRQRPCRGRWKRSAQPSSTNTPAE